MRMIVGGRAQGKHAFAKQTLGAAPERIVDGLPETVRRLLTEGRNARTEVLALLENAPDTVFVCEEIGCGLVPPDRFEREYRDEYGKICCELAARADEVYRVFCGIGERLK